MGLAIICFYYNLTLMPSNIKDRDVHPRLHTWVVGILHSWQGSWGIKISIKTIGIIYQSFLYICVVACMAHCAYVHEWVNQCMIIHARYPYVSDRDVNFHLLKMGGAYLIGCSNSKQ